MPMAGVWRALEGQVVYGGHIGGLWRAPSNWRAGWQVWSRLSFYTFIIRFEINRYIKHGFTAQKHDFSEKVVIYRKLHFSRPLFMVSNFFSTIFALAL